MYRNYDRDLCKGILKHAENLSSCA